MVPIHLPPLRRRQEDIQILANHFLSHYWERHRGHSEAPPRLSESTIDFLKTRHWRGNVRELQNVIEQLTVLTESGSLIQPDDVPMYDDSGPGAAPEPVTGESFPAAVMTSTFHEAKDRLIAHFEKEYLTQLIGRAGSNMSKAARLANIDRTTLYRLMEKHGFRRDDLSGITDE